MLNNSTEGKKEYSKLSLQSFLDHFKKLNDTPTSQNVDMENSYVDYVTDIQQNEILNSLVSSYEIEAIARQLKSNKAPGMDHIVNEFLKHAPESLFYFLSDLCCIKM